MQWSLPAAPTASSGGTVSTSLCLPNGCYTLTMLDSYGDGICCSYGNGSYSLKNSANQVLASGGQYTTQDVKTFCFNSAQPPQGAALGEMVSDHRRGNI